MKKILLAQSVPTWMVRDNHKRFRQQSDVIGRKFLLIRKLLEILRRKLHAKLCQMSRTPITKD